jgi:hypothetical protein
MNALAPVFASLHNFLNFVVFENFVEYDQARTSDPADSTRRRQQRLLFNAVVAFDSAVDYAFQITGGAKDATEFLTKVLAKKEPALLRVREFANAMKHCVTKSRDRLDASGLATTTIHVSITIEDGAPNVDLDLTTDLIADAEQALDSAWRFWHGVAERIDRREPLF